MSSVIHVKTSARNVVQIDFGGYQRFFVKDWFRQNFAHRIDDTTTTANQYGLGRCALDGLIPIGKYMTSRHVLARGDDKATSFKSDHLHGRQPNIAVINRRRGVNDRVL